MRSTVVTDRIVTSDGPGKVAISLQRALGQATQGPERPEAITAPLSPKLPAAIALAFKEAFQARQRGDDVVACMAEERALALIHERNEALDVARTFHAGGHETRAIEALDRAIARSRTPEQAREVGSVAEALGAQARLDLPFLRAAARAYAAAGFRARPWWRRIASRLRAALHAGLQAWRYPYVLEA